MWNNIQLLKHIKDNFRETKRHTFLGRRRSPKDGPHFAFRFQHEKNGEGKKIRPQDFLLRSLSLSLSIFLYLYLSIPRSLSLSWFRFGFHFIPCPISDSNQNTSFPLPYRVSFRLEFLIPCTRVGISSHPLPSFIVPDAESD